ncbi:MAG: hypothetical protein JWN38_808 [Candidatus Saccharibacteria bacterium]|nr:hypothetical protein [Candidatus Saccharibacteria bacterium]
MSVPNSRPAQAGFTLIELLIAMTVMAVVFLTFGIFFNNYLRSYADYQKDGSNFTQVSMQSERIANVMRGLTAITSAAGDDLVGYAYFSPGDTYTSLTHYYYDSTAKSIKVEVTPMTANYPTGTPITAQKQSYTIVDNYTKKTGSNLFDYFDSGGNAITLPISDLDTIVDIQVNLVAATSQTAAGQTLNVKVSLRNRKINL